MTLASILLSVQGRYSQRIATCGTASLSGRGVTVPQDLRCVCFTNYNYNYFIQPYNINNKLHRMMMNKVQINNACEYMNYDIEL